MTSGGQNLRRLGHLIGATLFLFALSAFLPITFEARLSPLHLPAWGGGTARLTWSLDNVYGRPIPLYPFRPRLRVLEGSGLVRLVGDVAPASRAHLEVVIQPNGTPGQSVLELDTGLGRTRFALDLRPSEADLDEDGLPDAMELRDARDREAFRGWFTAIAEAQFYRLDSRFEPIHRDCAGLVRFAFKEALRRHDRAWLSEIGYLHHLPGPDVRRYNYPEVPIVGERLFRIAPGAFDQAVPVAEVFSASANARALWEENCRPLGRSLESAERGDLLFFRSDDGSMHSMILLDPGREGMASRVVYHTGTGGEVRLVRLADLGAHRDDRWHPVSENPCFLGVCRLKLLEGGQS